MKYVLTIAAAFGFLVCAFEFSGLYERVEALDRQERILYEAVKNAKARAERAEQLADELRENLRAVATGCANR